MKSDRITLTFEIGFFLKSHFSARYPTPLYRPSFVKYEEDIDYNLVTVETCVENIDELMKYYESLFLLIDKHSEQYPKHHIWLRPGIFLEDELLFGFPWYDRLADVERLYQSLLETDTGTLFAVGDQGWYFEIFQQEKKLLFYETSHEEEIDFSLREFENKLFSKNKKYHFDFDEDGFVEYTWVWEYKKALTQQIQKKIIIAREVIDKLVAHFSVDYWSKY